MAEDNAFRAGLLERGVPEAGAAITMGMFEASRRGELATTDPELGTLLGREPTPLGSTLEALVP